MARVSVIMGVYNCKNPQLLKKSVDSIIKQTFTDWEFIICNDGSTDDTLQLLNEVAQSDSRIKVISYQQGRGLAYALNRCIKASTGEYIARQDHDDISEPTRFQAKVRFIGYRKFGMLPKALPYVLKPVLIGLMPQSIFKKIRERQYK